MKNNTFNTVVILASITCIGIVLAISINRAATAAAKSYVMDVCSRSRLVVDGNAEQACGDAQDKYDLEFLCSGLTAQAGCWVEEK